MKKLALILAVAALAAGCGGRSGGAKDYRNTDAYQRGYAFLDEQVRTMRSTWGYVTDPYIVQSCIEASPNVNAEEPSPAGDAFKAWADGCEDAARDLGVN